MVKFNGELIKEPIDFEVQRFKLTKSGRLASGRMTMEIKAKKRKLLFKYPVLSGPDLELIASYVDGDMPFFKVTYLENDKEQTITVYSGALSYRKFRTDGKWYWKDVSFDLIEQ